jgi:hypothetical protein
MTKTRQKSVREIKRQLEALKPTLEARFRVESIEIFGSFTRGDQTERSDIDLLVTFSAPYNLWEFLDLKEFLTNKLRRKVDLVPKDSIKSVIRDQILQEAKPI